TAATDLISDVGLEAPWIEVVELGTRMRALSGSGAARTDWRQAGMSAETDHVSVFDLLRSTQHAEAMRHMRFTKVASDLRARWPFRRGA
ncbi:MAG: hypothetical protein GWN85_39325, partial [Gemmatimonadetes bacterium]|nr:hypothetical protein [Gemmatimonadota bacterium]NIR41381.1 hypothetical protein [Actinomycetota bacterium]NIS36400.1 hypothetical protein [Actinomycetota bacterium]NIU70921.1 hypothetical protein [Actinomycetota bacterium]NIW32854.1 hypothetical protein [Actinomycetota bacterium]